jgi:predicted nucleic acid-binding protein
VKIVVDTYAWIELLIGSEKGTKVKELLDKADEVYTPDIVLAETARKFHREGTDEETINRWIEIITNSSTVVAINLPIASQAAKCYMELAEMAKKLGRNTPSLFDAIVYAVTKVNSAKIVTGDEHFKGLSDVLWVGQ